MSTLHAAINELASRFAHDLLRSIRGASLDEILHETSAGHAVRRGPGRPPKSAAHAAAPRAARSSKRLRRRSPADLTKMVEKIIGVVRGNKKGINAEHLRAKLNVARKELPRPLALALKSKKIKKRGVKRATTYFAA